MTKRPAKAPVNELMDEYYHYRHIVTVAEYDTDFKGFVKPCAILNYLQEAAAEHAQIMGFGYNDMRKNNLAWVIVRMSVIVLRCPYVSETLHIATFPEKTRVVDVDRGYYVTGKDGDTVILGASKWCVIDVDTHKIQRCAPLFENLDPNRFVPFPPFNDANPRLGGLPAGSSTGEEQFVYSVQLTDLDRNIHMNNARYGDVILNVCGMDILKTHSISRLDINFMSQLFYGDRFNVSKIHIGDVTYIEAKKADTAVFRAKVQWSS